MEQIESGSLKQFGKSGRCFAFTFFKWNNRVGEQGADQQAAKMGTCSAESHPIEALTEEKPEGPKFESQHCGSHKAGKLTETLETCLVSIRKAHTIATCLQAF